MVVNILLGVFGIFIFWGVLRRKNTDISKGFLQKDVTDTLKGIAIIAIAFSHIMQDEPILKNVLIGENYTYRFVFSWGGCGVAIFFLLSGYGGFLSISKCSKRIDCLKWVILHFIKCLLYFVMSFAFVLIFRAFIIKDVPNIKECVLCFISLKLPGTSSWYFKIQLLFYLFLAISAIIKKIKWILE